MSTMQKGDERVQTDADSKCPFCGQKVSVRWGSPPEDPGHLFHGYPLCKKFEELTADEFVKAVVDGKHKN